MALLDVLDSVHTAADSKDKAFDSVNRGRMFQILSAYGIPSKIINAIRCVYDNFHSFVSTQEGDTASFPVQTGVLQGDTLAPFLFIIVLDYVLRGSMTPEFGLTLKHRQSSRHSAVFLTDLDFADNIALLSDTIRDAQVLLSALECAAKEVGLLINKSKTKTLVINTCTTNDILSLGILDTHNQQRHSKLQSQSLGSRK